MTSAAGIDEHVVALAGGVGGARLVDGLDRVLGDDQLTVIVNTGDDFEHWGLHISPDLDTVMYTLAGLSPEERGWGIEEETFATLQEASRRGLDDWFQLGDRDLVTHLFRTAALHRGESLTEATRGLCDGLGVRRRLLPMTDAPRPTTVVTPGDKRISFQDWLVKERAGPAVSRIEYGGTSQPSAAVLRALDRATLICICPSNPYVSIDPILSLAGVRARVRDTVTVAVSPIVGGKAVKGPLGSMIQQIEGVSASASEIARHYEGLLDGFVVHTGDRFDANCALVETNALIVDRKSRVRLAREVLDFAETLR